MPLETAEGELGRLEDFLAAWGIQVEPDVLEKKRMRILRLFRFHLNRKHLEMRLDTTPDSPEWEAIGRSLRAAVYDATLPALFAEPLACAPSACSACHEGCE